MSLFIQVGKGLEGEVSGEETSDGRERSPFEKWSREIELGG